MRKRPGPRKPVDGEAMKAVRRALKAAAMKMERIPPSLGVRSSNLLEAMAQAARVINKSAATRYAFEAQAEANDVVASRTGAAPYLRLVRYFAPGSPGPSAKRFADAIEVCVTKGWSESTIAREVYERGLMGIVKLKRKRPPPRRLSSTMEVTGPR
jgi:hypothetical protein